MSDIPTSRAQEQALEHSLNQAHESIKKINTHFLKVRELASTYIPKETDPVIIEELKKWTESFNKIDGDVKKLLEKLENIKKNPNLLKEEATYNALKQEIEDAEKINKELKFGRKTKKR